MGYPRQLSDGRRLALAPPLAIEPKIMLFDEPTSDLDPEIVHRILDVLIALTREGMPMTVLTHEMASARQIAKHMVFMDHSRVIEEGRSESFFEAPVDPRTRRFVSRVLT